MAKKITWLVFSCLFLICLKINGQNSVGIGTPTPNPKAVLELVSPGNNQGLLVPRLTTAQRTAGSFTSSLSVNENGLLVFDSDDQKFYYWQNSQWLPIRSGSDAALTAGTGINITGSTISAVADGDGNATNEIQDLSLSGNTLKITNNASATGIDLSPFIDGDGSATNEIQDLSLIGNTLRITNNASATAIDLSPFAGTNTDDQDLQNVLGKGNNANNIKIINLGAPTAGADAATKQYVDSQTGGDNLITAINNASTTGLINTGRIAAGTAGQFLTTVGTTPTWATVSSLPPSGAAGGDLTGTYPNPTIATGKVTSAAITDGTIATTDLANNSVTDSKIAAGIAPGKITAGTAGQFLTTVGTTPTWSTISSLPPSGAAGGDLTGTYPNPTIATGKVTSAAIADGTIVNADILNIDAVKITTGIVPVTVGGTGANTAAGARTNLGLGTLATASTITTTEITDGTIVNADITSVDASKITTGTLSVTRGGSGITAVVPGAIAYGGATNFAFTAAGTTGQLLQSNGTGIPTWINPPAASGTAGGDLTGSFPNPTIATGKVTSTAILDATILTADIADNIITSIKISDGVVSSADITDNSVATGDILDATIATVDISDNAITSIKISDGVVSSADITDNTIATADIAANAVTPAKIASSGTINHVLTTTAVGTTAWAALPVFGLGSVTSVGAGTGLTGGPITTTGTLSIAAGGVTVTELASNAVTDVKVANVAPGKLTQSGANSGDVLKWNGTAWAPATSSSGTVTSVGAGTGLTGGPITTTGTLGIAAGGVTATELAANAVTDVKIATGITASKITSSGTIGQVLTTTGAGTTAWANPVDNSNTNEIQTLSIAGSNLTLSNGGGTVAIPGGTTYTAGAGIAISTGVISNTGDLSSSNEIQDLKSVVNQGTPDGDNKPIVNVGSLSIGLASKGANLHVLGSQAVSVTLASGGVFDIKGGDEYLVIGGAATSGIRLPDAAAIPGRVIVIRSIDPKGFVVGTMDGADKIDSIDTLTLNDSNGAVNAITVVAVDKDQWYIINKSIKY